MTIFNRVENSENYYKFRADKNMDLLEETKYFT